MTSVNVFLPLLGLDGSINDSVKIDEPKISKILFDKLKFGLVIIGCPAKSNERRIVTTSIVWEGRSLPKLSEINLLPALVEEIRIRLNSTQAFSVLFVIIRRVNTNQISNKVCRSTMLIDKKLIGMICIPLHFRGSTRLKFWS